MIGGLLRLLFGGISRSSGACAGGSCKTSESSCASTGSCGTPRNNANSSCSGGAQRTNNQFCYNQPGTCTTGNCG